MRPGLANAFLIGFIESIADFGNPIVLGGNFGVLATEVFFRSSARSSIRSRARRSASLLLGFALAAFFAQRWVLGRKVYTARRPARATPACRPCCPRACARLCYAVAVPWVVLTIVIYVDGAHRRFRGAMGPRLHA